MKNEGFALWHLLTITVPKLSPSCQYSQLQCWFKQGSCLYYLWCLCAYVHVDTVVSNSLQPLDCSPPGSSVHGTLQARILEWVAIFFRKSSQPRDWTCISCIFLFVCLFNLFSCTLENPHTLTELWILGAHPFFPHFLVSSDLDWLRSGFAGQLSLHDFLSPALVMSFFSPDCISFLHNLISFLGVLPHFSGTSAYLTTFSLPT